MVSTPRKGKVVISCEQFMNTTDDKLFLSNMDVVHHIHEVRNNLYAIIQNLDQRARLHDQSKLESPEQEIFASTYGELEKTEYGTDQWNQLVNKVKPAVEHHYQCNSHHPEHWKNGINDMSLMDVLEMIADWCAAVHRTKDGDINKSIDINAKRFGIDEQLCNIMKNTIKEMCSCGCKVP
jgi:hypothetical protein